MKTITLQIPDELYARLEQVAAHAAQSPEAVLQESIDVLLSEPTNDLAMNAQLAALPIYSDQQLWSVVHKRLLPEKSQRLHELLAAAKQNELNDATKEELSSLVDLVDRYMLLRSQALLLLKQRGQDIESYWKTGL
jgi:hypothetical protein